MSESRWPIRTLGEVAEFLDHMRRPVKESEREPGPYPYYGANAQQGWINDYIFDEPLILLAEDGGNFGSKTRPIAYTIEGKTWVNNHAHVLRPKESVDIRYLFRQLEFYDVSSVINGATRAKLNKSDAEKLPISVPSLEEQKRIAAILDKADSLRRKRQQAISLADDFLRAVFLDMFGDPVTNLKGWPVSELKALGQVSTGRTPPGDKPGMFDGETPFVTPGDLESDAPAKRSLTEAGVAEVSTVRSGATLVCCIGATIGKMGKATQRSAFNQQINAVEWNGLVDDDYGLAALRFFKAEIARQGASTTLPILKKSSFEKLLIPVPPIELQQVFTEQVAKAERLRFSTKTSLAEIESLQAALQNESFA